MASFDPSYVLKVLNAAVPDVKFSLDGSDIKAGEHLTEQAAKTYVAAAILMDPSLKEVLETRNEKGNYKITITVPVHGVSLHHRPYFLRIKL